jgi:crossover junction endodeoxyribonuclease RuvC
MTICRILGLDPGLRLTGWGIIESSGNRLSYIAHGTIKVSDSLSMDLRLARLFQGIQDVVAQYAPTDAVVEETFLNANPATTLKLGQARGVVLVAPAVAGIPVAEYSANHIKKMVVGVGHADKEQVKVMVKHILPTCRDISSDEADALAAAICHAHTRQTHVKWGIR